jgi:hypothetical protein
LIDGADAVLTVSVATLEVTLPQPLLTTTLYEPALPAVTLPILNVAVVEPVRVPPFLSH